MRNYLLLFFKGMAMGAANVIPGVSGGTIAFITGIYERLIDALKSFDVAATKLIFSGKFKEFAKHVDLWFLAAIFLGVGVSIVSLAMLLEWLFLNYEVLTMAFFFGLIIASVYLVGKQIGKWSFVPISMFIVGAAIAIGIAFLNPASENASTWYLIICGLVAISSMILPGLSGSYVLLIMGNYLLVLGAVGDRDFGILIPIAIGCVIGLLIFSRVLSYVFKHFRDGTIGLLTGFVAGSLLIIWPWKEVVYLMDETTGTYVFKEGGEKIEAGYEWLAPQMNAEFGLALLLIVVGVAAVIAIERLGTQKPAKA